MNASLKKQSGEKTIDSTFNGRAMTVHSIARLM